MTDYYLDPINGNDGNSGATWALRKKTLEAFSGVAVNGDNIRVVRNHGDMVDIPGGAITTNNSVSTTLAVGAAVGCRELFWGYDATILAAANAAVAAEDSGPEESAGYYGHSTSDGVIWLTTMPQTANTKILYIDLLATTDLSAYKEFMIYVAVDSILRDQTTPSTCDDDMIRVKLCSDDLGDVVIAGYEWPIEFYSQSALVGSWNRFVGVGNVLPSNVRSIAIYTGPSNYPTSTSGDLFIRGGYAITDTCQVAPGDYITPKIPGKERRQWERVCRVVNGTTASPTIYPCAGHSSTVGLLPGTYVWEALRPEPWTRLADFQAGTGAELTGWQIDNMVATFENITLIGGHHETTGAAGAGYTVFDLGMGYGSSRESIVMRMTVARTLKLKHMLFSCTNELGSLIEYQQFASLDIDVLIDYEDVHVVIGSLIYDSGDVNPTDGSILLNCSCLSMDDTMNVSPLTAGHTITFDGCYFNKQSSYCYWVASTGNIVWRDCWWGNAGTWFQFQESTSYTGRHIFEGTNVFYNCADIELWTYASLYTGKRTFSAMEFYGCNVEWRIGGNTDIDGLKFISGTDGYPAYSIRVWADDYLSGRLHGNNYTNWFVDYSNGLYLEGGTYEDCTIYTTGVISDSNQEKLAVTFRNCQFGRRDNTGTVEIRVYYGEWNFYGCTLNRVLFKAYEPQGKVKMIGGTAQGSGINVIDHATSSSSLYHPSNWLFHNVSFPDYDVKAAWFDSITHMDSNSLNSHFVPDEGLVFSGYDGNPTDTIVHNPLVRMSTTTSPVHTAGGRAWHVKAGSYPVYEDQCRVGHTQVALRAGLQATVKIWVWVTESNSYLFFKAEPEQIGTGQPYIRMVSSNLPGQWEELTYQFTPNADGVVEFYVTFDMPSTTNEIYYDDISITQE